MYASIFGIMFFFVFVLILIVALKNAGVLTSGTTENNKYPRLTVEAVVVSKRDYNHADRNTDYFVTFQFESGDRFEFKVLPAEYGMFVEADYGKLTLQGNKFIMFQRTGYLNG